MARRARRRVLRAARRGRRGDGVLRPGGEPDDALPRARVVLDRALRPVRDRHRPGRLARGGAEVPGRRRASARRRCSSARRSSTARPGELELRQDRRRRPLARRDARRRPRDDHRRARLQVVGRAVPHVDAGRLRGRADAGDVVHVVGDEDRRADRDATACSSSAFPARGRTSGARDRGHRVHLARWSATSPRSCSGT